MKEGQFFEEFPSEICCVRSGDLWHENEEQVPNHWFAERAKNIDEGYAITLFGLCGGLIKPTSSTSEGFFSSSTFKHVLETINHFDISAYDISLQGKEPAGQTPKSSRIAFLERELVFYWRKVNKIERSIEAATLETQPNTPALGSGKVQGTDEMRSVPV